MLRDLIKGYVRSFLFLSVSFCFLMISTIIETFLISQGKSPSFGVGYQGCPLRFASVNTYVKLPNAFRKIN
ncbi:uncharacterized protein RHIMIDRAFT_252526, partial [Rhizopus microsporus ATCC 52813]